jgi:FkbM family methyltransferase
MLTRLGRAALGLVGLEVIRLPGYQRRLLLTSRRTRRAVGPDLVLRDHLALLFDRYAVDCVLDVGANRGQYGHELRQAGYRGRLMSFEPVEHLCRELRQAAAGDATWSAHCMALGREAGAFDINVTRHDVFTSFRAPIAFAAERFGDATTVARHERVTVRRLEEVLDELCGSGPPPRCFLKMDTQGYDLEVFAGLGHWIDHVVGLQSEVAAIPIYTGMPRMAEAIARYEAAGFELTGLFPLSRDEATGRVIEFDCTMVRAAAARAPRH